MGTLKRVKISPKESDFSRKSEKLLQKSEFHVFWGLTEGQLKTISIFLE